jgi:formylglycine-generating enzyme required for sulfatase activity
MNEKRPLHPGFYYTDYWTTEDQLHFSDFRQVLCDILMNAATPLTVGVFGPWGSGKTSLLRMLEQDIKDKRLYRYRPVWFTAWKYGQEEALWRAFILRVVDALYPHDKGKRIPFNELSESQQEQVAKLQRLEESVYRPVDWEELGRWTVDWWQALKGAGGAAAEIAMALLPGGGPVAETLKKVWSLVADGKAGEEVSEAVAAVRREVQTYHREQLHSLEQFEAAFAEAVRLILGDEGRLIVFVDDLDRCLPEKAVEVLEAIKLFLEVPGTIFVIGMDRQVIERGIEARYGRLFRLEEAGEQRVPLPIRGDTYLQKIVQIPFHLPPLSETDVGTFIEALEGKMAWEKQLSEMTRRVFAYGLFPNPRQVKRAVNIFRVLQGIALARQVRGDLPEGSVAWPLLAKTVLIQTQVPELYEIWRQYPTLIQTLEEMYTQYPQDELALLTGVVKGRPMKEGTESEGESDAVRVAQAPVAEGSLLYPYLSQRRRYALLERLLIFPPSDQAGEGEERARFAGLSREEMAVYVRLAGAVGAEVQAVEEAVAVEEGVLELILSGDEVKVREGVGKLQEAGDEQLVTAARQELIARLKDPAEAPTKRAAAADALARLDDPRSGVGLCQDGLPDIVWCEVPAGPFTMGSKDDPDAYDDESPQHEQPMPHAYRISKYPVTNAQFSAFVQDGGYDNPGYWTEAGWQWRERNDVTKPPTYGGVFDLLNHPVVGVSWYEAVAFCRWLMDKLGVEVQLPSEAEWEKAARGTDRRRYPWGDEPDPNRANYDETGIGTTSAVGIFPGGETPCGCLDMSGNVWEWTRSLWGEDVGTPAFKYPYDSNDGRENLEAEGRRVLRGGAFDYNRRDVRCACRHRLDPDYRLRDSGFRVCVV